MRKLRQFYLQLAFLRLRTLGENRQNQPYAVEYAALQFFLQIAFLRRRQLMVEHHQSDIMQPHRSRQLFRLARSDKQGEMRPVAFGRFHRHQFPARGAYQIGGFVQGRLKMCFAGFSGIKNLPARTAGRIIRIQHDSDQHHAFGFFQRFIDLEHFISTQTMSFFQTASSRQIICFD